ncbi:tetratricopeptide repeat protein [Metapseudomonas otitidis]|uniref:tetratricopeptide repeat protein n=1 Tax=Metapseudomonas otitidis TaxID=319939 RepID=UPI001F10C78B|nr:sel1 repeat family protein [Pseudomonas otitidis]
MHRCIVLISFIWMLVFPCAGVAELSLGQQAAKERGLMLYNQHKAISAEPYLKEAAEAGDREAQYFLGEALRFNNRHMTEEAYKWYAAAAAQGDYYAMYRLARTGSDLCSVMGNCSSDGKTAKEWLVLGRETAKALAEQGDAEAMYVLYYLTTKIEWLEKAAEAGRPEAQYDLARYYQKGNGFFFPPWRRSERACQLLEASAQGGYIRSMLLYQDCLYERGDNTGIRYWIEKAVEKGDADTVIDYVQLLSHKPERYEVSLDLVRAYGFLILLEELDGGGAAISFVEDFKPKLLEQLTPEQIEQAKAFAKEWKATHPPLSYFPEKLGF